MAAPRTAARRADLPGRTIFTASRTRIGELFWTGTGINLPPSPESGIVYVERQQGYLTRVDVTTGEVISIQPQPSADEDYERFNWDAPILVSPHDPARLYFASQRLWRSDNRGDEWTAVSGDLTKNQDRMTMPIMGRQKSWDSPWDLAGMSNYNTITFDIGVAPGGRTHLRRDRRWPGTGYRRRRRKLAKRGCRQHAGGPRHGFRKRPQSRLARPQYRLCRARQSQIR